jgi:hypothetical protein
MRIETTQGLQCGIGILDQQPAPRLERVEYRAKGLVAIKAEREAFLKESAAQAGKLADIVIVGGNPMDGYWHLLDTKLVIKAGVIVSDQR